MAEEILTIYKVGTEEAVKNINDLKNNISTLKQEIAQLDIGSEKYQEKLDELKVNQNALKDAMYATSASMEDVAKAATGASESYNSLVHRMASLKEEFRATNDEVRRSELGKQIKEVNDQLKDLDALQGNFQRNVGNYAGSIKEAFGNMAKNVDALGKSMKVAGGGVEGLKNGFEAFGKSPAIATIGLLVTLITKLAGELKENETAMNSVKAAMNALKPVMDFFSGILDTIVNYLADIIGKVAQFVTSNGLIDKLIKGVMGVGNAILNFVVSPFKAVIAAINVFKEQGIKGIGNAAKAFGQEMKAGVSFKENFKAGQAVAETFIAGAKSKKKDVKDAGRSLGKEAKDGFLSELDKMSDEIDKEFEKGLANLDKREADSNKLAEKRAQERLTALEKQTQMQLEWNEISISNERIKADNEYNIQAEADRKKLDLLTKFRNEALDRGDLEAYQAYEQERADLAVEIEMNAYREKKRIRKQELDDMKAMVTRQKELLKSVASATSSILGSIADMYDSDTENSEKNANKIKALRIAGATIDTISGAIGAYMQSVATIPPPSGIITGIAQAAAVTAAGIAQIAKLKNTKVSTDSTTTSVSPAVVSAPTLTTEVTQVRSLTSASEEDRLNRMAKDQRVYILSSDIEASQNSIKTQVAESSF